MDPSQCNRGLLLGGKHQNTCVPLLFHSSWYLTSFPFIVPRFSLLGTRKSTQTFSGQSFSRTLRVMDVQTKNRAFPHQKNVFLRPWWWRDTFDPRASGRKGQECQQEIRTKMFKFMLEVGSKKALL